MRGVVDVFLVAASLVAFTIIAPAAIEGVGEFVINTGSLSSAQVETVRSFYEAIFVQIPLVAFFGTVAFAVAWYLRQQSTITRR